MITSPFHVIVDGDVIMVIYEDGRFTYMILYNHGEGCSFGDQVTD
jgi:hypothetical protein